VRRVLSMQIHFYLWNFLPVLEVCVVSVSLHLTFRGVMSFFSRISAFGLYEIHNVKVRHLVRPDLPHEFLTLPPYCEL
jgi:hypothetical protein